MVQNIGDTVCFSCLLFPALSLFLSSLLSFFLPSLRSLSLSPALSLLALLALLSLLSLLSLTKVSHVDAIGVHNFLQLKLGHLVLLVSFKDLPRKFPSSKLGDDNVLKMQSSFL